MTEGTLRFASDWARAAAGEAAGWSLELLRQGSGRLERGRSVKRKPLCLAGRTYGHGLGTHADSEIVFRSSGAVRRFSALVGLDDSPDTRRARPRGRIAFTVEAADRVLWRSPALGLGEAPASAEVDLPPDTRAVTLRAVVPDGLVRYAHADWAEACFTLADGREIRPGRTDLAAEPLPLGSPVRLLVDGRDSADLLPHWTAAHAAPETLAGGVTVLRRILRDPATGLELRTEIRQFEGFPAVEWVAYLRNGGTADSPLLSDIRALDACWNVGAGTLLHRSRGSRCRVDDFLLQSDPMDPGTLLRMAAGGGRSSNDWLPFFNLQTGEHGLIAGIGWTGQWEAVLDASGPDGLKLRAGMERTRLRLHPGEEIRTPRILLLFWEGDRQEAHNALRRFVLLHHTPYPNGRRLEGPLTAGHWGGMRSVEHRKRIGVYAREKLGYDYYWVDAGWYGPESSFSPDEFSGDWAMHVGNWQVNPKAHPEGLRPLSDAAKAAGMGFLLWFEPERAMMGTPLTMEHPEWFLGERLEGRNLLFDLGLPEARRWLTDAVSGMIDEHGVSCYRQDFNFDPLPYWRAHDAEDRQGMSEIRHVEGLYAFWDELLARHPGLVIDNCASGGRRIDLETMGRSIPLWRSDVQCFWDADPIGAQVHGMGLSLWVPLSGTGVSGFCHRAGDTYNFRSHLAAAIQFSLFSYESSPIQEDYPYDWHRKRLAEFRRMRPLYHGDYYPLTPNTVAEDAWAAYQMHRPDLEEGFLLALRRMKSPFRSADFRLRGLEPEAAYEVEDADTGRVFTETGRILMERGVRVDLENAPQSGLFFYRGRGAVS